MKKTLLLLLIQLVCFSGLYAQGTIDNLTVMPANPMPGDTIRILASCTFFSGPCNPESVTMTQTGSSITGVASHCLGMLAVICDYTDTFVIEPQPPGSYTFSMELFTGSSTPCNTQSSGTESVSFTVGSTTSVPELPANGSGPYVYYNNGSFMISRVPSGFEQFDVNLFDAVGRLVYQAKNNASRSITVSQGLPDGVYIMVLSNKDKRLPVRVVVR